MTYPMCHVVGQRGVDPVWLFINPEVIKLPRVMITDAASNQNGVVPQAASPALDNLHLDFIYQRTDWTKPEVYARRVAAEKYEVLVPQEVAVAYIVKGL